MMTLVIVGDILQSHFQTILTQIRVFQDKQTNHDVDVVKVAKKLKEESLKAI